jgi:hypothetical protein
MALTKVGKEGITGVDNSADATAVTIDSSENVTLSGGLSMTSDDPTITMTDSSGTNDIATIQSTSGALIFTARDGSSDGDIIFKKTDGSATDESMRISSEGNLLIGTATKEATGITLYGSGANGFYIKTTGTCGYLIGPSGAGTFLSLYADSTAVGNISTNGSTTSYNTSSDYRLKENVVTDWDATTRLKQLKPSRFNFIADADTTVDGFLAHEVQSVVPEAISGTHNEVDDDGNAVMQGIDQSKLVPLLVKTIQELEARITALESA